MNKKSIVYLLVFALVAVACATEAAEEEVTVEDEHDHESTLEQVQERGFLKCGVSGSAVAFSETQADGSVTGIDADYCYAVAAAIDKWVRGNTVNRFGPVREVEKDLVVELAFDSAHESPRHKSGIALRFPRVSRIRWDKPASEADTIETVRKLIG